MYIKVTNRTSGALGLPSPIQDILAANSSASYQIDPYEFDKQRVAWDRLERAGLLTFTLGALTTLYIGKHGSHTSDGTTIDPLLSFTDALNRIEQESHLTPSASNRISIQCVDGGEYVENLIVPAYVSINAPCATLTSAPSTGNTLQFLEECNLNFNRVIQSEGNPCAVVRGNSAGTSIFTANYVEVSNGLCGVINFALTTQGILIAKVNTILVSAAGAFGIGDATSGQGHTHIALEDVYLAANNTSGVVRGQSGSTVGHVSHILGIGGATGTTGVLLAGTSELSINVQEIDAVTAYNVPAGTELNMFINKISGSTVIGGTINVTTP